MSPSAISTLRTVPYFELHFLSHEIALKDVNRQLASSRLVRSFRQNRRDASGDRWLFRHHQHFWKSHLFLHVSISGFAFSRSEGKRSVCLFN